MLEPIQVEAVHDDAKEVLGAQQLGWLMPSVNKQEYRHAVSYFFYFSQPTLSFCSDHGILL